MVSLTFSGPAEVALQGPRTLQLTQFTPHFAEFTVSGLADRVRIRDYRRATRESLSALPFDDCTNHFPHVFSEATDLDVSFVSDSEIDIELREHSGDDSRNLLWIAFGFRDALPRLDYLFHSIVALDDGSYAGIALAHPD